MLILSMYRFIVATLINYRIKSEKKLIDNWVYNFFKSPKLEFCLPAYLTTVARMKAKRSSIRPPFYAIIANSSVGCAFCVSDECLPLRPVFPFILNQAGCHLHAKKPYPGVIFCMNTFLEQHI